MKSLDLLKEFETIPNMQEILKIKQNKKMWDLIKKELEELNRAITRLTHERDGNEREAKFYCNLYEQIKSSLSKYFEIQDKSILGFATKDEKNLMRKLKEELKKGVIYNKQNNVTKNINSLEEYYKELEQEEPFKTWGKLYEIEEALETIMKCDELTFSGGLLYKKEFEKIKGYLELSMLYQEKADIYERNYGQQMNQADYTRLLEVKKLLGERE